MYDQLIDVKKGDFAFGNITEGDAKQFPPNKKLKLYMNIHTYTYIIFTYLHLTKMSTSATSATLATSVPVASPKLTDYRSCAIPNIKGVYLKLFNDNIVALLEYIYTHQNRGTV